MTLSCEILHLTFPSLTKCKTLDLTHHYCIMHDACATRKSDESEEAGEQFSNGTS